MDIIIILAVLFDLTFGELPNKVHPVFYIGKLIRFFEGILDGFKNRFFAGVLLFFVTQFTVLSVVYLIYRILPSKWHFPMDIFVVYSMISVLEMKKSAVRIFEALIENDILKAKNYLKMIVSRDVENMDEEAVVKSAIESVAENFNDSVFAPLLFYTVFGVYGIIFFRVANTLDAMIGYKNDRYIKFGKFVAKMDDVLNFFPARLQVVPVVIAAEFLFKTGRNAFNTFLKFRSSLESPNSGCGISLFAGVLKVRLGGNASYFGVVKEKPVIDGGFDNLNPVKILKASDLFIHASLIAVLVCAFL